MAAAVTPAVRLATTYDPSLGSAGGFELLLVNDTAMPVTAERLAVTSIVPMHAPPDSPIAIHRRLSVYHELACGGPFTVDAHGSTVVGVVWCGFPAVHAGDGPVRAFLIHADDSTTAVETLPMTRVDQPAEPAATPRDPGAGAVTGRALALRAGGDVAARQWMLMADAERAVYGLGPPVLRDRNGEADPVDARIDPALGPDGFRFADPAAARDGGLVEVLAGGAAGLRRAFAALARLRRGEQPPLGAAQHGWRGLHVDLARQWYPAPVVGRLIEIAGWYGLNRLHLHLTDDEGWRIPIAAHPALADVGAWRGHGLPIPPLLGTGAERTGGSYTPAEIGGWVEAAASFGIEIVPEVDLPGHSFAALAALPWLRDPDDTTGAVSVQGFVDNVLNPGVAATMPFIERVLGEVADRFPGRWLHVGGDEVPVGAWLGSPAARRFAAARGVEGTRGIEAEFMRDVIRVATVGLGRQVGVWQEAAECGALRPGDGYAIGWLSDDANRTLAAAGYDVVAAPAQAYYLDMADRTDWDAPGASWAGVTTAETIAAFEPAAGWTAAERDRLLGVQACLWSEHVHDETVLCQLLLPRLAVFADRAWAPG